MSEDDIIYWQDVLESVLAKRTSNLTCPFCYQPGIEITKTGKVTRVSCTNKACRHYIEGSFGDHADQEGEG